MEKIRTIRLSPYLKGKGPTFQLDLFDTYRSDHYGKSILGYKLTQRHNGRSVTLFEGQDFACSPMHCVDSDMTVASLMGFLTLRKGDTDAEYFKDYTPEQTEFSEQHAEALSCEVSRRFGEA